MLFDLTETEKAIKDFNSFSNHNLKKDVNPMLVDYIKRKVPGVNPFSVFRRIMKQANIRYVSELGWTQDDFEICLMIMITENMKFNIDGLSYIRDDFYNGKYDYLFEEDTDDWED